MDINERMDELEAKFNELIYLLDESDIKTKVDFEHLLYEEDEVEEPDEEGEDDE